MLVVVERVNYLFSHFKNLPKVVEILNEAGIIWVMGGSAALYVQGNEREPGDIDIYIRDDQHDKVDQLFGITSIYNESATDRARISYPYGGKQISIHTGYAIGKEKKPYPTRAERFSDGEKIYQWIVQTPSGPVNILKAEDILLIKALLKRDENNGKKGDLEDIKNFKKVAKLDQAYLEKRFAQMNVDQATRDLLLI